MREDKDDYIFNFEPFVYDQNSRDRLIMEREKALSRRPQKDDRPGRKAAAHHR
jgi:hypothetical protein